MTTHIRIAPLADHPHAAPLLARWCYDEWGRDAGVSLQHEVDKFQRALDADGLPRVMIALDGDAVIACAQLKTDELPQLPDCHYWLSAVYVAPAYRGRQIAAAVIGAVVQQARQQGVTDLYLQTEALDGGLYRRLGWEPLCPASHHGVPVLVMRRALIAA